MADSLFASAEAKALLDSGVVAKLSAAAEDKAPLFKITSTGPLAGVQWRRLAQAANLNDDEMDSLRDWVEETIGDGAATRFAAPLPDVAVTVKKEKAALELRPSAAGGRVQSKETERAPAEVAFEQFFGGAPAAGEAAYTARRTTWQRHRQRCPSRSGRMCSRTASAIQVRSRI